MIIYHSYAKNCIATTWFTLYFTVLMVMFQCYIRLPEGKLLFFLNNLQLKTSLPTWGIYVLGRIKEIARNRCGARHVWCVLESWMVCSSSQKKNKNRGLPQKLVEISSKNWMVSTNSMFFFEEFLIFCGNSTNKPKKTKNLSPGFDENP